MNFEKKYKHFTQTLQDKVEVYHSNFHDHICTIAKTEIVL